MSPRETHSDEVALAFGYAWMSSTLSGYCRAVDARAVDAVVDALAGVATRFRERPESSQRADLVALYSAAFDAMPPSRHLLSPLHVRALGTEFEFEAPYQRLEIGEEPPRLAASGVYRGRFVFDGAPRWLSLHVATR